MRKAKLTNQAMIGKLGWRLMNKSEKLWVEVMRSKYNVGTKPIEWRMKKNCSHIWKGIIQSKELLINNTKWILGDGRSTNLWKDWWCGNSPINTNPPPQVENMRVADFVDDEGGWNFDKLAELLQRDHLEQIQKIFLPIVTTLPDYPSWVPSSNGTFTCKSAYKWLNGEMQNNHAHDWKWLWKSRLPFKIILFLWLCANDRLPTNALRTRRMMTDKVECQRCGCVEESIRHILFDCFSSIIIWNAFIDNATLSSLNHENIHHCIKSNVLDAHLHNSNVPWNILFVSILWAIWKRHNRECFDKSYRPIQMEIRDILSYAKDIYTHFPSATPHDDNNINHFVKWSSPNAGLMKLNTDASLREDRPMAGIGGILRDSFGNWIKGYYGRAQANSPLEAELKSIHKGLQMIKKGNYFNVIIESDCKVAVDLINGMISMNHSLKPIISECKTLLRIVNGKISHAWRESNFVVDKLAEIGSDQDLDWVECNQPPNDVIPWLQADLTGVAFDMFAAGTDTTSTVVEWAMVELLQNPQIIKKLQNEITEIAEGKPFITEDDLENMQYLKAVIKETLRFHPPAPLLVPRESTQDMKIMGYDIANKTQVIINAWAIGRDPLIWDEPEEFKPERFMNSPVDYKGQHFELIPFGAGRRGCPGISFAVAVNELALPNLVHNFDFALPSETLDTTEGTGSTIRKKSPILVSVIPHQS